MIITHKDVVDADCQRECRKTGKWIAARSVNYRFDGWYSRLKQAWGVLIGRYDAFDWEDGDDR